MNALDPMEARDPEKWVFTGKPGAWAPRCQARSKQQQRQCLRAATPGTSVCSNHGSKAPQTQAKARLRLATLVDPAIGTLAREMATAEKSSDRQRAANSILDRAGVPRQQSVTVDDARDILAERLAQVKARREEQA